MPISVIICRLLSEYNCSRRCEILDLWNNRDHHENQVLHLEPGTIGFNSFTPAEYLKEMLGRFMNARKKGGAMEEFEQKKQGVN